MTNVILRNVTPEDLPIFFTHQADEESARMAGFASRPRDAFDLHWAKILADKSNILRTILFNNEVAGNMGSWEQDGKREVCYWLGKEYWGKGIATQSLILFLEDITFRPLYAHVVKHNLGSQRVLAKCGFELLQEEDGEVALVLN